MDREIAIKHDLLDCILRDEKKKPARLPLWFLESITENFSDSNKIGSGGFADVYMGLLPNGKVVAVKKLRQSVMVQMQEDKFLQEIKSLMKANHKYVVRLLGYCCVAVGDILEYEGKHIMAEVREKILCFEFLPGCLHKYIKGTSQRLDWGTWFHIINGICEGLHYLHKQRIVHSDLKPANILLDHGMVPKIADFGLAKCFDEEQTRVITKNLAGSEGYMAPEIHGGLITFKSDIYSLGIIVIEILTGEKMYRQIDDILEICNARFQTLLGGKWLEQVTVCAKIGLECMDIDQAKRPSTQHIVDRLREVQWDEPDVHHLDGSKPNQVFQGLGLMNLTDECGWLPFSQRDEKDFDKEEMQLLRLFPDREDIPSYQLHPPDETEPLFEIAVDRRSTPGGIIIAMH